MELRECLKELRLKLALMESVPAFLIFNDETLNSLVVGKPQSINDLLEIKGIGSVKSEKYGEQILNIVHDFRGRY